RAVYAGNYLYITMAAVGYSWQGWRGYACDMGGAQKGCILRYELTEQGEIIDYQFVTPDMSFLGASRGTISEICGFGCIHAVNGSPNELICSTQCCEKGDAVFYSTNAGQDWKPILYNLEIGKME